MKGTTQTDCCPWHWVDSTYNVGNSTISHTDAAVAPQPLTTQHSYLSSLKLQVKWGKLRANSQPTLQYQQNFYLETT